MKKVMFVAVLSIVALALPLFAADDAKPKAEKPKHHELAGAIKSIDTAKGTLTITDKSGVDKDFTVGEKTKIATADKKIATLADLKVTEKVHITFADDAGKITVIKISPVVPEKPKAPKTEEKK